jgi:hypothetical protein
VIANLFTDRALGTDGGPFVSIDSQPNIEAAVMLSCCHGGNVACQ